MQVFDNDFLNGLMDEYWLTMQSFREFWICERFLQINFGHLLFIIGKREWQICKDDKIRSDKLYL